jgi:hypothetical protein
VSVPDLGLLITIVARRGEGEQQRLVEDQL